MMTLCDRIRNGAGRPSPGLLTVALSGGADSTALLCCLSQMRETLSVTLRAVHIHHGIRGEEADRDAAFCAALCAKYGIRLETVRVRVPEYAAAHGLSVETAARLLRYQALEKAAPDGEIATAHHAGDNAETVLFHLIRGSGLNGLTGIPARSGRIIRPLLDAEKSEILAFLREIGQEYRTDSSNFSDSAARNRIRHHLLPLLTAENPAAVRHICRTAAILSEDEALLSAQALAAAEQCRTDFGGLKGLEAFPRPIRMRVYMERLHAASGRRTDPNAGLLETVDRMVCQGYGALTLSAEITAQVFHGALYLAANPGEAPATPVPLRIGENRIVPGCRLEAELLKASVSRNLHTADTRYTLDFDKICGEPCFRRPARSDQIRLPGRDFSGLLRKRIQSAVPALYRRSLHALYDREGCIFCEGVGVAARVKPNADSRTLLRLRVIREEVSAAQIAEPDGSAVNSEKE
ncbi:MAG: tRNA lysidine(34) synthetase TilS [Oscillospiraceae bacterium]|nr:tRNA lysidine(34) synthetase TilS [Oscillospiraceae bacterium]